MTSPSSIVNDYYNLITKKIDNLDLKLNNNNLDFYYFENCNLPSKTAQNGLNMLSKESENSIINSKDQMEVVNMFKLIYLLLDEEFNFDNQDLSKNLIDNFYNNILEKYNSDSLSKTSYLYLIFNYFFPQKNYSWI